MEGPEKVHGHSSWYSKAASALRLAVGWTQTSDAVETGDQQSRLDMPLAMA